MDSIVPVLSIKNNPHRARQGNEELELPILLPRHSKSTIDKHTIITIAKILARPGRTVDCSIKSKTTMMQTMSLGIPVKAFAVLKFQLPLLRNFGWNSVNASRHPRFLYIMVQWNLTPSKYLL